MQYPCLTTPKERRKRGPLVQSLPIKKEELDGPSDYYNHLAAICDYLNTSLDMDLSIQRWGTSAKSGCYHSTMVDYSRAGRAGSAGSAGRNLNVCGRLW